VAKSLNVIVRTLCAVVNYARFLNATPAIRLFIVNSDEDSKVEVLLNRYERCDRLLLFISDPVYCCQCQPESMFLETIYPGSDGTIQIEALVGICSSQDLSKKSSTLISVQVIAIIDSLLAALNAEARKGTAEPYGSMSITS